MTFFKARDKAVIVASVIIAIAFLLLPDEPAPILNTTVVAGTNSPSVAEDHWLGNPDAPIVIVEYSDTECLYCVAFHVSVVRKLMETYGKKGELAWVYRHFPIANENPNSPREALALECVSSMYTEPYRFWNMLDALHNAKPLPQNIDHVSFIKSIANLHSLSENQLTQCERNPRLSDKIRTHATEAIDAGAQGAPFMLVYKDKNIVGEIQGTRSLHQMIELIESIR